jgi:probable F420-dependent oxidoreductase
MRVSVGLPTHRVDLGDEFVSADGLAEMTVAAEQAGFWAVSVTDHPFPDDTWMKYGGHFALDPFSTLAYMGAASETIKLHTNLLVVAYRNPYLAAHQVATLDRLSGGRVVLGIGAGYLEPEFEVLGADFANRNDVTDDAIVKMKQAWTGESIDGHTMRPTPAQAGGPPIWIGGNSKRAARRAVELGAGWSPFPNGNAKIAARTRTTSIMTPEDLGAMVRYCTEHAEAIGRTEPLDVVFMPVSMTMFAGHPDWTPDIVVEEVHALAEAGMTAMTVTFEADSRKELADDLARFGDEVLPRLPS